MNRTIEKATVKKYHYETHDKLKEHIQSFIDAHNLAKRLKANKVSCLGTYCRDLRVTVVGIMLPVKVTKNKKKTIF